LIGGGKRSSAATAPTEAIKIAAATLKRANRANRARGQSARNGHIDLADVGALSRNQYAARTGSRPGREAGTPTGKAAT